MQTTEYEYDRGQLVRSVTTREPEWTELDRAEMFAYAEYRSGLCQGCGQSLDETTSPEGDGNPDFRAKHVATCRGCMALIDERRAASDSKAPQYAAARRWIVKKTGG